MVKPIIIKNRILIPKNLLTEEQIESRYKVDIFKERNCKKCDNREDRLALGGPNDLCIECPSFIASYKLYKETENYWSVPQGDELFIKKYFSDNKIIDKRKDIPFSHPIKFTKSLFGKNYVDENGIPRVNQKRLVKKFLQYNTGILQCRPRSGKTPMSIAIAIELGQKTIIMAHKKALLRQFYNTLVGKTKSFTNIPSLQHGVKQPIVVWAKTKAQIKNNVGKCDFLLINYQKFVRNPDEIIKVVDGNFGTLILDEAHNSGAEGYLRVASKCSVKYRISLSATPKRKDGRHKLINRIMGPVVAKSESVSLIPKITVLLSRIAPAKPYKSWPHAVGFIFNSKKRNEMIVNKVISDLKSGHGTVIIPVDHLNHQKALIDMFNKIKPDLAVGWNEKSDEEKVLARVESKSKTVLVAIRSMIREGVDMAKPSCIHVVVPMSAESEDDAGAPMFDQLVNRVCTPTKNKKEPLVRIWVDDIGMFQNAFKSLFFHEIWKNRYNSEFKKGKYSIDPNLKSVVSSLSTSGKTLKRGWV